MEKVFKEAKVPFSYHHIAMVVAGIGLLLRLVNMLQIISTPLFPMMATDSEYFDAMARHLLTGNWGHPDAIFLNPFYPVFLAGVYALGPFDHIGLGGWQSASDNKLRY